MNFSGVIPKQIYTWIQERDSGNSENYDKCKEDTQEAIDVFSSLYGSTFRTPYQLFIFLNENLCMRNAKNQSFYRAFIALHNDDVITIRLSQHFATNGSVKTANKNFGKPTVEYHLIIERTQIVNHDNDLFFDRRFKSVTFKIREMDLAEFNDGHFRKDTIDEIITLLTYGESGSGNNNSQINTESKNMNTNKKVVRLTESQLHNIIAESVSQILNEWGNSLTPNQRAQVAGRIDTRRATGIRGKANYSNNAARYLQNNYGEDPRDTSAYQLGGFYQLERDTSEKREKKYKDRLKQSDSDEDYDKMMDHRNDKAHWQRFIDHDFSKYGRQ